MLTHGTIRLRSFAYDCGCVVYLQFCHVSWRKNTDEKICAGMYAQSQPGVRPRMSRSAQVHIWKPNLVFAKLTKRLLCRIAMAEIRSNTQSYGHEIVGVELRVVIFISV